VGSLLTSSNLNEYRSFAENLADIARSMIAELKQSGRQLEFEVKEDQSPVTEMDTAIEKEFRKLIEKKFPTHGVLGEELGNSKPEADLRWVIDPIDGTTEFLAGLPTFGCIISLYEKNEPVLGLIDHPDLNLRLTGVRDQGVTLNSEPLKRYDQRAANNRFVISAPSNFVRIGNDLKVFNDYCREFKFVRVYHSCYTYTNIFLGMADLMLDWQVKPWDRSCSRLFCAELGVEYFSLGSEDDHFQQPDFSYAMGRPEAIDRLKEII